MIQKGPKTPAADFANSQINEHLEIHRRVNESHNIKRSTENEYNVEFVKILTELEF